ncbi:MAG: prolyl oligopeptidase family serine peptidase [Clostridia bacterium]|nr:prolyl oligopeptidase family serine peptidase [Clostridia bacterium]
MMIGENQSSSKRLPAVSCILIAVLVFTTLYSCTDATLSHENGDTASSVIYTANDNNDTETDPSGDTEDLQSVKKPSPPDTRPSKIILKKQIPAYIFTSSDGQVIPYRLFVPEDYSEEYAYPVLLFLHGAGQNGDDNEAQLNQGTQEFFIPITLPTYHSIMIIPQCPAGSFWVDTDYAAGSYSVDDVPISRPMKAVVELLDEINSKYSTDPDRQYVTGESMGGYGTWDLLCRYPDRFAAAVAVCGAGDPSKASLLTDISIRSYHGRDDTMVPFEPDYEMIEAIKAAGGSKAELIETTSGNGHFIATEVYRMSDMIIWLFEQVRSTKE